MPDLKTLKVSDLISLMQGVLGGFNHKEDCAFLKLQGNCSCGLDQLRKDISSISSSITKGDAHGEKK